MIELQDNGATSTPSMSFHRPGAYATKIVLSTDNRLYFGGWSAAVGGQTVVTGLHLPGANVTYDLGATTLRWSTVYGLATSAQYADLAEKFLADDDYPVGTVMMIGGTAEVTASTDRSDRIVGTISEKPAFIMNDTLEGDHVVPIAYIGRVPCRVKGPVRKGDFLAASDTPGVASSITNADIKPGQLVGRALADSPGTAPEDVVEIIVGRL